MAVRVSQGIVEALDGSSGAARVSQQVVEALDQGTGPAHASQLVVEALDEGGGPAHASQLVIEALDAQRGALHVSQLFLEILLPNVNPPMYIYPILQTLGFDVVKRPKFFNSPPAISASGREVRVSHSQYPLWEFELTYDLLRDTQSFLELKTLLGFFLLCQGDLTAFAFKDPDDCAVTRQSLATTDGINSQFGPLVRTYGFGGNTITEPIGLVDLTQPFNLYVDGVLVAPTDPTFGYSVVTTYPVAQTIHFNSVPPSGHVLTVDMSFYYWVRFYDPSADFTKFANRMWSAKKIKLVSQRG